MFSNFNENCFLLIICCHIGFYIHSYCTLQDEEIYQLFCGSNQVDSNVEAVRVIRDSHTSQGKGIAYVLFKTRVCFSYLNCVIVDFFF